MARRAPALGHPQRVDPAAAVVVPGRSPGQDDGSLRPEALGRIAEGFLADVVLVDGDPTVDIACLDGGVARVMRDGRFVSFD